MAMSLTYIHNWPLQPIGKDYDLASQSLMLCVLILYISGQTYSLKLIPNDRFIRNSLWQFYLLSEFLPEIC